MSKISQKILTLLLVIAMVFGVSATTIAAVTDDSANPGGNVETGNGENDAVKPETDGSGSDKDSDSDSGSITKGWCNIEYDGNQITVIVNPDKEAILGTKKDDIKELAGFIAEAVKKVVVDDMLADVLPDGAGTEIDPDTIWFDALDGYLENLYGKDTENKYVEFLKNAINDEQVLEDFAKHVCALLKAGVLSGIVELEDLPAKEGIEDYISDMLNDYVDSYIDEYVTEAVDEYISYCLGESAGNSDVIAFAEEYLISYTREALENYIKALKGEPTSSNDFQAQIEEFAKDYINDYVKDAVADYVQAKVEGNEVPSSVVNAYIEEFITDEISSRVDTYIENKLSGTVPTDEIDKLVDEYAGEYINDYIKDAVADYIDAKVNGTALPENEVNSYIEDFVDEEITKRIDTYIENKLAKVEPTDEVDKLVANYANEYIDDYVLNAVTDYIEAKVDGTALPEDEINSYISKFVTDEINERVDAYITDKLAGKEPTDEVEKLVAKYADEYVEDYIADAVSDYIDAKVNGTELPDNVVNAYVKAFIDDEIGRHVEIYIANKLAGKEPTDDVDKIVTDYADAYVKDYVEDAVSDYIAAKVNSAELPDNDVNAYIKDFVDKEIGNRVDKYIANKVAGTEPTEEIDILVAEYADEYLNDYVNGAFDDYINAKFGDGFIDESLKSLIDEEIKAYFDDYYDDQTEAYKTYVLNGRVGEKPALYDVIEPKVKDAVIAEIMNRDPAIDNVAALEIYEDPAFEISEYLVDVNFADYKEEAIASLVEADYRDAFATVDVDELAKKVLSDTELKDSIKADIKVDDVLASIGTENADTIIATVDIDTVLKDALADEGFKATIRSEIDPDAVLASIDPENVDNINKIIATVDIDAVLKQALEDEDVKATIKEELKVDDILASMSKEDIQKIIDAIDLDAILEEAFADESIRATIKAEIEIDAVLKSIGAENIQKIIDTVDIDEVLNKALKDEKVQKLIKDEINVDDILVHMGAENVQKIIDTVDVEEILNSVSDEKRAEIVDSMYKEYTDDKVVELISDIIKDFKTNSPDKLDKLIAEVKAQVEDKIVTGELDDKFQELFGVKITEVLAEIDVVAKVVGGHYADTITEIEETPEGLQSYIALLDLVQDIRIDDISIYGNSENGKVFLRENIEQLLRDLPKFEELENMKDEEMFLSYAFKVVTVFSDCEFSLTVKLVDSDGICDNCGEDFEKTPDCGNHKDEFGGKAFETIRKVAGIINRNVKYSFVENDGYYDIVLDVNVPEELAKAVLRACESGRISDELKNKVFDKISYNGDEVYAFINESVSLEDLIELLDKVDVEGVLDSEFVSRFEKLDGLTVDEIKDKIREYENYYNKALDIMRKAYAKIPAGITEKTLFDLYDEEAGNFHANYNFDVDLGEIAYKANEKLANYLEAFLDNLVVKGSIDATVAIENIHKVTYVIGGNVVKEGFLPVGANVAFFSGITEFEGETVIGWVDGTGLSVSTMPNKDTVVYAITKAASAVLNASATEIKYGEGSIVLTAVPSHNSSAAEITYAWYKDGVVVEGAAENTLTLTSVADSGTYYCAITVTDAYGASELVTNSVTVTIKPIEINIEEAVKWDYENPFTYDEKTHEVAVKILDEYKDLIKFVSITSNSAIDADTYVAKAMFELSDATNYVFTNGNTTECEWKILPIEYSEKDLVWGNVFEFVYEYGVTHTLAAPTAPKGLTVDTVNGNTATDAGVYTVKVTLKADKNYKWVGAETVEKEWKILARDIDLTTFEWKANGTETDDKDDNKFTFVYNGKDQGVYIDGLPEDLSKCIVYTDNTSKNATGKTLTAKAELNYEGKNYNITGSFTTQDWEIVKAIIALDSITWTEHTNLVYNGKDQKPTLVGLPDDDSIIVTYSYYMEKGDDNYEIVSEVKNAGRYKVVVTIVAQQSENFEIVADLIDEIGFDINKAKVEINAEWDYDPTKPFTYDGNDKTVALKAIDNANIKTIVYEGNVYKFAGKDYKAKATIALKDGLSANYELFVNGTNVGETTTLTLDWVINKKVIIIPALSWTETIFEYDGTEKTVTLITSALSAEVLDAIDIKYGNDGEGNKAT